MFSNLGTALRIRFDGTGTLADLDQAIKLDQEAIDTIAHDHPDRAMYLANLGTALAMRFERTGALADLDQAIAAGESAVDATPTDHPNRATCLSILGAMLHGRFDRTGALADLDLAIVTAQQAVDSTPTDHPNRATVLACLGNALLARFERERVESDRGSALAMFRLGAKSATAAPLLRAYCGKAWARLAGRKHDWDDACQALAAVIEILPQLVDHGLGPADRRHHLSQLQGLGTLAAHAELASRRRWRHTRRVDAALTALEAGRGVLINQALETRTDLTELQLAHPELADQVSVLRILLNLDEGNLITAARTANEDRLASAKTDRRHLTDHRRQTAERWRVLLAEVRSKPGFERFGQPPTPAQMRAAATGGTVVAINVTEFGCTALILGSRRVDQIPLPDHHQSDAVEQANRFLNAIYERRVEGNSTTLFDVLAWLWDAVAGPVLKHLGYHRTPTPSTPWPRIWWIPTGALSLLPLHAAGHHDDSTGPDRRTVLDRVVSSYTPTVRALLQARERQHRRHSQRALVVGVSRTFGQPELQRAEVEASEIHQMLNADTPPLLGDTATHAQVTEALPHVRALRFARQVYVGLQDGAEPAQAVHNGVHTLRARYPKYPNAWASHVHLGP